MMDLISNLQPSQEQLTISVFLAVQDGEAVEAVDGVAGEVAYETY